MGRKRTGSSLGKQIAGKRGWGIQSGSREAADFRSYRIGVDYHSYLYFPMGIGSTEVVLAVIFLQRKAQLKAERVEPERSLFGG